MRHYFSRKGGVGQRSVKIVLLLKRKRVDGVLQRTAHCRLFLRKRKDLLNVQIGDRTPDQRQQLIKIHVPLQLHYIVRTPGAEDVVVPAPLKKTAGGFGKRNTVGEILHIHMNDIVDAAVDRLIYLRLDQLVEGVGDLHPLIHPDRPDLYDLKRKTLVGTSFATGALVPFKVKNYIIHVRKMLHASYMLCRRRLRACQTGRSFF